MEQRQAIPIPADPRWNQVRLGVALVQNWLAELSALLGSMEPLPGTAGGTECSKESIAEPEPGDRRTDQPVEDDVHNVPLSQPDERVRLRSMFSEYGECQEAFTTNQWEAICLRFRDGLTEVQIAAATNRSRSAIHGLLKRSRERKEAYRRQLREEHFCVARKYLNS